MQKQKDLIEHPTGGRTCLRPRIITATCENWFYEFEIPIAENMPDEIICCGCRFVVTMLFNGFGNGVSGSRHFASDPAVDGYTQGYRIKIRGSHALIHLGKACRVP